MATIFISYRRDDAFGHAGRMYDRLVYRFGPENIFMDLDSMQPGLDFEQVIEDTIARCDAVIAIIGKAWLSPTAEGASRLDDPHDWVRLELTYALRKKVRLIPVLFDGAGLPSAAELPSDLSALRRLHSIELSQATWNATATDLINTIDRLHPTTRRPGASSEAEALARQGSARRSERPQEPETWSVNDLKAPTRLGWVSGQFSPRARKDRQAER